MSLTKLTATTRCCYTVTQPTLPQTLYATEASTSLTTRVPFKGIVLNVSTCACPNTTTSAADCTACASASSGAGRRRLLSAGTVGTLSLLPSGLLNFSSTTSKTFSLYATRSGYYLVSYSLVGSLAYVYDPPASQVVYIFPYGTPIPGPLVKTAQFSDAGSQILVDFAAATDRGKLTGTFSCGRVLRFVGAGAASCFWLNDSRLIASLPSAATIVPGQNVTLLPRMVKAFCPSRVEDKCVSWGYSNSTNVTLAYPTNPVVPKAELSFSSTISYCAGMEVDGSSSTGSGGRAMTYTWSVRRYYPASKRTSVASNITSYLWGINPNTTRPAYKGTSKLTIPTKFLTRGATFAVVLSLTNWLGVPADSSTAYVTVTGGKALPSVKVSQSFP